MPILSVYVDDRTHEILRRAAESLGREIDDLAECAIAEADPDSLLAYALVVSFRIRRWQARKQFIRRHRRQPRRK